jgi:hypothetical protein
MACKAELLKEKNAIVTKIDFMPGQPVTADAGYA